MEFHKEFGDFRFHRAIEAIFALVRELNRKLEEYKPWSMAKSDPDSVPVILNTVLKGVVFCLYYLRPVLPHVTVELLSTLKLPSEVPFMDSIDGFELTELQLESWPMLFARLDLTGESAEKK
ncbi:MAG: class I tRNA ligase family protein [Leptospiraceae bacterium]|nr:class I tRNA ligase family protein [Leptospiraceae bacterium]